MTDSWNSPETGDGWTEAAGETGQFSMAQVPAQQSYDPILMAIGDIGLSRGWVVTPNGTAPMAGSQWIVRDMSRTESTMPAYAIVLAILLFVFCLLGLFFLLIKETKTTGYVEVSVQSGHLYHVTQIPVSSAGQIAAIRAQVHHAQGLALAARP